MARTWLRVICVVMRYMLSAKHDSRKHKTTRPLKKSKPRQRASGFESNVPPAFSHARNATSIALTARSLVCGGEWTQARRARCQASSSCFRRSAGSADMGQPFSGWASVHMFGPASTLTSQSPMPGTLKCTPSFPSVH